MPPKKASTAATKKSGTAAHASYRDMIKDAILNLKERNGSSRYAIKKYIQANNKIAVASSAAFDSQFNKAIKSGVEKGEFTQPKGPSGPVKLAKKDADAKPTAKSTAKSTAKTSTKSTAPKKAGVKKAEKPAAKKTKKTGATKKTAGRPTANTAKPRKSSAVAPAIVEQPTVLSKTKSGRVVKTIAKPAEKTATKKRKSTSKRT